MIELESVLISEVSSFQGLYREHRHGNLGI